MGAGEVWIDDVQVFGLVFEQAELVELSKLITLAEVKLQNGQIGDCLRLLEGYWRGSWRRTWHCPRRRPGRHGDRQARPAEEKPPSGAAGSIA